MYNLLYNTKKEIERTIYSLKKLTLRQRKWFEAKSKTAIKKLKKRNKQKKILSLNSVSVVPNHQKYVIAKAPSTFSLIENSEDTLKFFDEIFKNIKKMKLKETLFFDLSSVEYVSVDSVMYLIALIKNTKRLRTLQIECMGNIPTNENARNIIESSGFYDYVSPQYSVKKASNDHINITKGNTADPCLAGKICTFVHQSSSLDRIGTKSLFPMIMELMTNTNQHAYKNNNKMKHDWYVFVKNCVDYIQFVFLDTGEGIPNTIRTDFYEKIKNIVSNNDAFFIASALKGEFRTETNLDHRGKGLPEIYKRIKSKSISDFFIVSGGGKCFVDDNGNIIETKFPFELRGTLFSWKLITKKGNKNG